VRDYFKKTEYVLERLWFDYLGSRYEGRGIMTWNPDEGFHVEAFLDRHGSALPKEIPLGKVGIPRKSEICSIRMKPHGFDWAIAPNARLIDRDDILWQNRLSINLNRVIFSKSEISNQNLDWHGTALYETKRQPILPNYVKSEVWLNNQKIEWSVDPLGIWYEDEQNQRIAGRLIDDRHLKLHWKLSKSLWSKTDSWQWSEAAQDALSIWFGETIWLLQREVQRANQRYIEVKKRGNLDSVGLLSPFDSQSRLDENLFISLTEFLVRNERDPVRKGRDSTICRNIFKQMLEASRQQTWQATELLLSTILEAALRSIDEQPFRIKKKKDSFDLGRSLTQFFENYLSDKWIAFHTEVMKAHNNLRNRNAHPDWLFSQGGYLSEEEMEKSLDDMIFLSRFYGYMILALAGFKELEPRFPSSHKEWKPLMTIGYLEESELDNFLSK
jgi:hypothetical protein